MNPLLLLLLPALAAPRLAAAEPASHGGSAGSTYTTLAPTAMTPVFPVSEPLAAALSSRSHAEAATLLQAMDRRTLSGSAVADHAFVTAWSLSRSGNQDAAARLLPVLSAASAAPPAYVALLTGELLMSQGKALEAAQVLSGIPDDSGAIAPRVQVALAEAWLKAERTSDSRALYEKMITRADPASGSAVALWALARRNGLGSPSSLELVRRIYRYYPGSAEDTASAESRPPLTIEDLAWRGYTLQQAGSWSATTTLLTPRLAEANAKTDAGCRYRYAYGRAQHKNNNITTAAQVLIPVGKECVGKADDLGAQALYLAGKSLERKKDWAGAAAAYRKIPELYPKHSMADDGYALGGIATQEAGDLTGARALWAKGISAYPDGDLAAESAWRLAWGAFLAGDTAEALRWADTTVTTLPIEKDPTHWLASAYWGARWRAWPSNTAHSKLNPDPAALAEAADRLERVARTWPGHWYALLAASRLAQLDATRARALSRPTMDPESAPWQVRSSFLSSTATQNAMGLLRVGLVRDAIAEFATHDSKGLTGAEMAIITGVTSQAGDFLLAHDRLREYLKTHPPEALGPNAYKVLRQAYPEKYWKEVQTAAPYSWDSRLFLALVREESNFNPKIESHAGARGLSQLMPATAQAVAKRLALSYSSAKIWDIPTNLRIGASYLDTLHTRYHGNSALALAGYNAGEGNADRWVAAAPDAPTDYITETITFRETRFYVKRVSSTWLTYRMLYDDGPMFPDWAKFADDAVP